LFLSHYEWLLPMLDRFLTRSLLGTILVLTIDLFDSARTRAEPLIIQGSSTLSAEILTPYQGKIEALSGQSLKIVSVRSDFGLLRLLAGHSEFATISTLLPRAIESVRPGRPDLPYDKLLAFPVSQVRVAFVVNPSNPIRKTDLRVIRQILSGEVKNWKSLGGPDLPIRVAYTHVGGVTLCVAGELFGGKPITPAFPIRAAFGSQVVKVVEQEPSAMGVAQYGLVKEHQLPELITDQVIEQELSLVTLGEPRAEQQAVIKAVRQVASELGMPVIKPE
jgi:phosphate transport system substrate-binding protein